MRIPAGHIGLERQQDFGRCPHSCIGEGWALRLRRRPDKYTIETTETGHTPQKPPQSTTYIAKFHHGLNARKMGNKLILGGSRDRGRWTKDEPGNERHDTQPKHGFSIGSIFKSGPERIRQPFPRGNGSTESGFSLRKPHRGLRLAFRAGPLPCCRMKRSRTHNRPMSFSSLERLFFGCPSHQNITGSK